MNEELEAALVRAGQQIEKLQRQCEVLRSCTCHPDDKPPQPCNRRYALTECREADRVWTNEVLRLIQRHAPHIPMSEHGDEARAVFLAFARDVAAL